MVGLHHLIAFLIDKLYWSHCCKSDGIVRKLRDATQMGYAEEWWQHLWYWLFFTIRCLLVVFGIIFTLCMTGVVMDARSFIKNNQEMVAKYEALEYPTAQDYVKAYEYNKKYESARLFATEEV